MEREGRGNRSSFFITLAIGIISALFGFGLYVWSPVFLEEVDLRYGDFRLEKLRGGVEPNPQVVIVAIDEKSVNKLGVWRWPRRVLTEFVEKLSNYSPRVAAFDVVFAEPESEGGDKTFGLALEKEGNSVLGYFFRDDATEEPPAESVDQLSRSNVKLMKFLGEPKSGFIEEFSSADLNVPQIGANVRGFGFFNFSPDPDGVFRNAQLLLAYDGELYPSLNLESMRLFLRKEILLLIDAHGVNSVYIGETRIPTDEAGQFFINYYGPKQTFPTYSVVDVMSREVPPEALKDKLVFVGATETGIADNRSTPFDPFFPGVEIHATVAANILDGRFLIKNNLTKGLDVTLILALPLILVFLLMTAQRTFVGLGVFLTLLSLTLLGNYLLFSRYNLLQSALYPFLSLGFAYVSFEGYRNLVIERKSRYLRKAFSSYVSPEVVAEILQNPDKLRLGGESRNISVLFSDIRGFTSLSEMTSPEVLVSLLNEYLSPMTQIVMEQRGMLDKYIGDAVMAIFGAPLSIPDHPNRACHAALEMLERLKNLNLEWRDKGWPYIAIGIGISTGEAVVGNMGADVRFEYTAIGDTVNLASRLEGLNKFYGTNIIVSKSTLENICLSEPVRGSNSGKESEAEPPFLVRELDLVRVKGKEQPIPVFELMGIHPGDPKAVELIKLFNRALKLYRERKFLEAAEEFVEVLRTFPDDKPSAIYLDRCSEYIAESPSVNWDGVYTVKEK